MGKLDEIKCYTSNKGSFRQLLVATETSQRNELAEMHLLFKKEKHHISFCLIVSYVESIRHCYSSLT